nr:hypothetical protein GCM10025730_50230 [Promicromonospora thailandica]
MAAATTELVPGLAPRRQTLGRTVVKWITTTDHKTIGYLYLITSFIFFCIGGLMALLIRAELFEPGIQLVQSKEQYNQLFTMHGTVMLLLFATPLFAGFANVIMPLQIGAPDVAFPRLNMFAYWLFLFGGLITTAGFLTPRVPPRSAGSRTRRCRPPPTVRGWAETCGSSAWRWPVSARSSVRSTSSPRSSRCVRRA